MSMLLVVVVALMWMMVLQIVVDGMMKPRDNMYQLHVKVKLDIRRR